MFQEVLVVDYITDFSALTSDEYSKIATGLNDVHFLDNCPNGTVIGIPIFRGSNGRKRVYFPFFSHVSMPIKAGERAWSFDQKDGLVSYWITRKVQNRTAEDLNFTNDDSARLFSALSGEKDRDVTVSRLFYDENTSGKKLSSARKEANSRVEFVGEPVLSVRSRSVDLSLQGSNNTAIKLGHNGSESSGTIDIVAGLGTLSLISERTIQNSDGYDEAIKPVSAVPGSDTQPGDLSAEDSSRVIVSQKFSVDDYYSLPGDSSGEVPVISLSTDSVRIVARNDLKIVVGPSSDPSSIIMKSNGEIVITPSSTGVIKLGGDDASGAILAQTGASNVAGTVVAANILTPAGDTLGNGIGGFYAKNILVKI